MSKDVVIMCTVMYRTSLSLCPWAGRLSRVVPTNAFFLLDRAGMLRYKIKVTPLIFIYLELEEKETIGGFS